MGDVEESKESDATKEMKKEKRREKEEREAAQKKERKEQRGRSGGKKRKNPDAAKQAEETPEVCRRAHPQQQHTTFVFRNQTHRSAWTPHALSRFPKKIARYISARNSYPFAIVSLLSHESAF